MPLISLLSVNKLFPLWLICGKVFLASTQSYHGMQAMKGLIKNDQFLVFSEQTDVQLNLLFKVTSCYGSELCLLSPRVVTSALPIMSLALRSRPPSTSNGWIIACSDGALLCAPLGWLYVQAPWKSVKYMFFSPPFYRKGNWGTESLSNLSKHLPVELHTASALNYYTSVDFSFSSRYPLFSVL